jgi:hypothetical protein
MTYPVNEQNWQKRSYDSYGPHFRIETSNPELGMCGNVAYNLYGYADSGDISNIGMTGDGKVHVYGDQTITVAGGAKIDNGGVCVKIVGLNGDVTINAEKNGDVRISGKNIIFDAKENIEFTANSGKVQINSRELIATNQSTTRINAKKTRISGTNLDFAGATNIILKTPKGSIKVKRITGRDVDWAAACFAGTSVGGEALTGGGVNRRGSGVR